MPELGRGDLVGVPAYGVTTTHGEMTELGHQRVIIAVLTCICWTQTH